MMDFKKDKTIEPIDENLSLVLGDAFLPFETLRNKLKDLEMELEWRFYKDGGWLAKVIRKKKTIFWGAPETGYFTTAFHFNDKNKNGVLELAISDRLKNQFSETIAQGKKFSSLVVDIHSETDLTDLYTLIEYKKRA